MPRPSNTAERRTQITQGFIKIMAKRGYDGASIGDIAKAARLTAGLVHYHFKSKHEIRLAALHDLVAQHGERLEARIAQTKGDPIIELDALIDFHLGLGANADPEALACWILFSGEALRDTRVRSAFAKALASIARRISMVIRQGVAQGLFEGPSPDAAASALVATIQGYFVLAATSREVIPRGSAADCAKQMMTGLLHPARPLGRSQGRT